jgi:hypothetical protein
LPDLPDRFDRRTPPDTPTPQQLRGRLALVSVVGALMVALPLGQVLRYQGTALQALTTQRAALDPAGLTVEVQRALLSHRPLAAQVLRGVTAAEPERRLRQGAVDERVGAMTLALSAGAWELAVREATALSEDWRLLARQCTERTLRAAESDLAHRLLVEQALQVLDLLADATAPRAQVGAGWGLDNLTDAAWPAALALPRLAAQTAALPDSLAPPQAGADGSGQPGQREVAALEARLARTLAALDPAVKPVPAASAAAPGGDSDTRTAAGLALGAATAAAAHHFALLNAGAAPLQVRTAADLSLQAQFKLFQALATAAAERLDQGRAATENQRQLLLAVMALLALVALVGLVQVLRGLMALPPRRPHGLSRATDGTPRHAGREVAGQLLDKLRAGDSARNGAAPADFQPTLPPAP